MAESVSAPAGDVEIPIGALLLVAPMVAGALAPFPPLCFYTGAVALAGAAIVGLPALWLCQRHQWFGLATFVAVGASAGALAGAAVALGGLLLFTRHWPPTLFERGSVAGWAPFGGVSAAIGAVSALVYWLFFVLDDWPFRRRFVVAGGIVLVIDVFVWGPFFLGRWR